MINFELVDLITGTQLFAQNFDHSLINLEDDSGIVDYAQSLADDMLQAIDPNTQNPYAIKFYDGDVEFSNTNSSFWLQIDNGSLIRNEYDAMSYLLLSFYTFVETDGIPYLDSLAQIDYGFGITDQELTSITNQDLLVTELQTATETNWDVDSVKIKNPVSFKMLDEKGIFNIRSLYMNNLSNVKVVADLGNISLVLANLDVNSFDDNDYSLKLATESGVYAGLDGNNYFVSTEKYDELTNFRLEIDDSKYQALNNIETEWVVNFRKGETSDSDQNEVKKNIMMLTNLAYVLQSAEFDSVLDHYEEIAGKKFYMYQRYQDGSKQGDKPTRFTEEEISVDFSNPESRDYFYDVMGVRNATTGGSKGPVSSFTFIEEVSTWQGRSMTGGTWYNNQLQLGTGVKVTMNEQHSDYNQGNIITPVALHEMGHLFGYHHYSSFANGEAVDTGERVFYSLIQLMGDAGKLPYYDELPAYNVERAGFNKVEKFIYEHESEFQDLHNYLESVKDVRNATYDKLIPQIQKMETMDPFLRQLLAVTNNMPVNNLHIQDREAYALFGNTSCFYKL